MTSLYFGSYPIPHRRDVMKLVFLTFFICTAGLSCSKSSTSSTPPPPPTCTTDFCKLTGYKWEIFSQAIHTDLGVYTYQSNQLATINWATFIFKTDSTYLTYGGQKDTYSYSESKKRLVLVDNYLPLQFNVAFPTGTSLTLSGDTLRLHPRTDSSMVANFEINSIVAGLSNDFGVDTSRIHYVVTVFTYNGF